MNWKETDWKPTGKKPTRKKSTGKGNELKRGAGPGWHTRPLHSTIKSAGSEPFQRSIRTVIEFLPLAFAEVHQLVQMLEPLFALPPVQTQPAKLVLTSKETERIHDKLLVTWMDRLLYISSKTVDQNATQWMDLAIFQPSVLDSAETPTDCFSTAAQEVHKGTDERWKDTTGLKLDQEASSKYPSIENMLCL